jgi:hypothetical protein
LLFSFGALFLSRRGIDRVLVFFSQRFQTTGALLVATRPSPPLYFSIVFLLLFTMALPFSLHRNAAARLTRLLRRLNQQRPASGPLHVPPTLAARGGAEAAHRFFSTISNSPRVARCNPPHHRHSIG